MPRWAKLVIAVLLLPACFGAVKALARVVRASGQAETFWVALAGGAACWLVIFLMLPKPMRVYVFGHEFTHALWTWFCGGRVVKFKAGAKGGHVLVTKNNFLIALAPYFFPVYAVLVILVFGAGHLVWGWSRYAVWFHLLIGAAYAFHLTLTAHILQTRQSDLSQQGYLFSLVIIFLGNIGILLLGIPLLTGRVSLLTALSWWLHESESVLLRLQQML